MKRLVDLSLSDIQRWVDDSANAPGTWLGGHEIYQGQNKFGTGELPIIDVSLYCEELGEGIEWTHALEIFVGEEFMDQFLFVQSDDGTIEYAGTGNFEDEFDYYLNYLCTGMPELQLALDNEQVVAVKDNYTIGVSSI